MGQQREKLRRSLLAEADATRVAASPGNVQRDTPLLENIRKATPVLDSRAAAALLGAPRDATFLGGVKGSQSEKELEAVPKTTVHPIIENVLSAIDQASMTGFPGMQGAVPRNPDPRIMIPLMMLTMGAEPGPDILGPVARGAGKLLGKVLPESLVDEVQELVNQWSAKNKSPKSVITPAEHAQMQAKPGMLGAADEFAHLQAQTLPGYQAPKPSLSNEVLEHVADETGLDIESVNFLYHSPYPASETATKKKINEAIASFVPPKPRKPPKVISRRQGKDFLERQRTVTSEIAEKAAEQMDLSPEARLARAKLLGFSPEPVYHGTRAEFSAFRDLTLPSESGHDFGIHVGSDEDQAFSRLSSKFSDAESTVEKVLPLLMRSEKTALLPDLGEWASPFSIEHEWGLTPEDALRFVRSKMPKELREFVDDKLVKDMQKAARKIAMKTKEGKPISYGETRKQWMKTFDEILEKHGYDAVGYPNIIEGQGELSYMVRRPEQLRSILAKFDPRKYSDPDLMAILAGVSVLGGATAAKKKEEAK